MYFNINFPQYCSVNRHISCLSHVKPSEDRSSFELLVTSESNIQHINVHDMFAVTLM